MRKTRTLCDICGEGIPDTPFEASIVYNRNQILSYDLCHKHKIEFERQVDMHIIGFFKNQRHIATGEKVVKKDVYQEVESKMMMLESEIRELKSALKKAKNQLGRLKGFSKCGRCGDTWDWKEGETINYSEGRGMFPLCKECFKELDEKEILDYCKKLMKCWIGMGKSEISKNWDKMVDNLKTDIHKLKKSYVG